MKDEKHNCIWCGKPSVLYPGHLSCNLRRNETITVKTK